MMPISVEWENEAKTVILQTFDGRWSWNDFHEVTGTKTKTMMRTVTHTVHIVSDFARTQGLPVGGAFTQARNAMTNMPDNWGILVIVGANQFIKVMVDIFKKMFKSNIGMRTFTVNTLEEAYDIIAQYEAEDVTQT